MAEKQGIKQIAANRQARHEYFVEESMEAGIELFGTEVKSLRNGGLNLKDSWCSFEKGELFVRQMHISPYEKGNIFNRDPLRPKKLLLHRKELNRLYGLVKQQQGLTLIPLQAYFKGSRVKIELGVCRGKKLYDKRADAAKRDAQRDIERAMRAAAKPKSEYGGVPVSTGIEKQGKRVEALDLYKTGNLNINANTDYAYAA